MSLVPKAHDLHLVPVGRMGRDATGLMLLTNEVGWIHPLTHPSYSNRKKYELVVKGLLTEDELKELRRGLAIPSSTETLPVLDDLQIVDYDEGNELTMLKVTVDETSSTMLETMFGIIGSEIVSSKCLEFNGVGLRGLKKGEWKELTAIEITKVKTFCKLRTDEENQRSQRVVKALESTRFQQQQEEDRNAFYGNNNNQQSSYRNQATSSSPSSAGRQYSAPPSSNPRYPPRPQSTTSPTSSPRRESSTASPPSNRYNKDDSQSRSRSTTRTNSAALSDEDNKIPTKTSFLKYTRSKRTQS